MLRPLKKCQKCSDQLPLHAQQRPQPALSENFIRSENRWKLAKLLQCQDAIYVCMYVCMYMYFCMRMACKYFCPVLTFFCPYMCPLYVFFICICMYTYTGYVSVYASLHVSFICPNMSHICSNMSHICPLRSSTICNGVCGISVVMVVAGNAHTMGVGEDGEPCVWGCVGSGIHADSIT